MTERPESFPRSERPDEDRERLRQAVDTEAVARVSDVTHFFGATQALDSVTLELARGKVHALLGPNGAGKTTLIRALNGLISPTRGTVRVHDVDCADRSRALRQLIGFVPAGDRSFYLRISGLENLLFFARLHGLRKRAALNRARAVLDDVGLAEAADRRVNTYSHGMQKRLSVARALLRDPALLLVDEATHDLDPDGARRIRDLIGSLADRGTAVLWATQRIDEIRGFADAVTLISRGSVRFDGTVGRFVEHAQSKRHVLRCRQNGQPAAYDAVHLAELLKEQADVDTVGIDSGEFALTLHDGVVIGAAISTLAAEGIDVVACREERSEIEAAFLALTAEEGR